MATWEPGAAGVVTLPSGRRIRGRSLRAAPDESADWTLALYGRRPEGLTNDRRWVRWPDFLLPSDDADAIAALREAHSRALTERVEIACGGGRGRTGTALAAIAVLDGLSVRQAISLVRTVYHPGAVETPWQARWLRRLTRNP